MMRMMNSERHKQFLIDNNVIFNIGNSYYFVIRDLTEFGLLLTSISQDYDSFDKAFQEFMIMRRNFNRKFRGLGSINNYLNKLCQRSSLPKITCHALRHMCATILLEQGVPLEKISGLLGHTSIHTTYEYYCEVMDDKEQILAFMNNIFNFEEVYGV